MAFSGKLTTVKELLSRIARVLLMAQLGQSADLARTKELYNGHKRVYTIKFQSVVAPNGLIANLYGPVEGKRHDSRMLAESGLLNESQLHSFAPNGNPHVYMGTQHIR